MGNQPSSNFLSAAQDAVAWADSPWGQEQKLPACVCISAGGGRDVPSSCILQAEEQQSSWAVTRPGWEQVFGKANFAVAGAPWKPAPLLFLPYSLQFCLTSSTCIPQTGLCLASRISLGGMHCISCTCPSASLGSSAWPVPTPSAKLVLPRCCWHLSSWPPFLIPEPVGSFSSPPCPGRSTPRLSHQDIYLYHWLWCKTRWKKETVWFQYRN